MKLAVIVTFAVAGISLPIQAESVLPPIDQRFAAADQQETPDMQRHVLPLLGRLGCNGRACHGSFQGRGGFRLSLFGYDFKMDHEALTAGDHPRVDLKQPPQSLMLLKPTSTDPDEHGGGHRLDPGSWQYKVILRWIEAGAPPVDEAKHPHFVRMEVTPGEIVFSELGQKQRLKVVSYWSDGTVEDVTPICRFQSNDDAVSKVNEAGEITAVAKGDTHVVAFYDNGVVPVATLLPESDQFGPKYPSTPTPTRIDELVTNKLRKLGVLPSDVCSDSEFLRRASLDITGTLPQADEVRAFVADGSAQKRSQKIDELLSRPAYAAWWATRLCDVLGNSENQLRPKIRFGSLSEQWYRWVNRRLAENLPYDKLIEGMVMATGRTAGQTYEDYCREMSEYGRNDGHADVTERPTMSYYWARRNMQTANEKALSFSYALLGIRLQCAECHKHPFDQWSQQDFKQFTAFFDRIRFGTPDREAEKALLAKLEIDPKLSNNERDKTMVKFANEGQTIPFQEVYIKTGENGDRKRDKDKENKRVDATRVITPRVLGGEEVIASTYSDPRQPLMDWLRQKDNPYFARAFVNRVWSHYFNVGIVEPADDMNLANAPSNKELLDYLSQAFIEHHYDVKWLHREITGSLTYQRSWKPNGTNEHDLRNYSHAVPRRLPAEVVYDAVVTATAGSAELTKRAGNPVEECAIGLSRGYSLRKNNSLYALSVFGKPKRETPCDCERSNVPSLLQTVFLRNDQEMATLIDRKTGWVSEVSQQLAGAANENPNKRRATAAERPALPEGKDAELIQEVYLRTFSRLPDQEELAEARHYLAESDNLSAGLEDLLWALLNAKEFIVNH
jgi:hypothetical protein